MWRAVYPHRKTPVDNWLQAQRSVDPQRRSEGGLDVEFRKALTEPCPISMRKRAKGIAYISGSRIFSALEVAGDDRRVKHPGYGHLPRDLSVIVFSTVIWISSRLPPRLRAPQFCQSSFAIVFKTGDQTMTLRTISAVLLGVALCALGVAQEHAPLLATCEADVALWYNTDDFIEYNNAQAAFFNDKTPNKSKLNLVPVTEVIARHEEMSKCWSMTHSEIYHQADLSYMAIFHDRETDFMVRHNLMRQFRAEDAAGKR